MQKLIYFKLREIMKCNSKWLLLYIGNKSTSESVAFLSNNKFPMKNIRFKEIDVHIGD